MGGDGIKLICDLQNTSIRGALQILESGSFASLANRNIQSKMPIPVAVRQPLQLLKTQKIDYYPLRKYLTERRIAPEIYNKYLVEVHYSAGTGRNFIALGFRNDASDYEVRNKNFKGLVGVNKAMTSFDLASNTCVYVFE